MRRRYPDSIFWKPHKDAGDETINLPANPTWEKFVAKMRNTERTCTLEKFAIWEILHNTELSLSDKSRITLKSFHPDCAFTQTMEIVEKFINLRLSSAKNIKWQRLASYKQADYDYVATLRSTFPDFAKDKFHWFLSDDNILAWYNKVCISIKHVDLFTYTKNNTIAALYFAILYVAKGGNSIIRLCELSPSIMTLSYLFSCCFTAKIHKTGPGLVFLVGTDKIIVDKKLLYFVEKHIGYEGSLLSKEFSDSEDFCIFKNYVMSCVLSDVANATNNTTNIIEKWYIENKYEQVEEFKF